MYPDLPYLEAKNVNAMTPLEPGCMVIMYNGYRMYLGEVLDIFRKVSGQHAFIEKTDKITGLSNIVLRVFLPMVKVRPLFYIVLTR